MNIYEIISELRAGHPKCCDYCQEPFDDKRKPIPDEGQTWSCTVCWERWEKEMQKETK